MALESFGQIAEQLRRSTVQVASGRRGQGSGFIVKPDGVIVTNAHVVGDSGLTVRLWDGSSFPASLKARSTRRDLAVLRISTINLTPVTLANSDDLRVGELVIAVGNPLGIYGSRDHGNCPRHRPPPRTGTYQMGSRRCAACAGKFRRPLGRRAWKRCRGEHHGGGRLWGLPCRPMQWRAVLAGDFAPAPLGVVAPACSASRFDGAERLGLMILEVVPGSAAEYASLRAGDILIGVEAQPLRSLDDLEQALEGQGERLLRLQFVRGDPTRSARWRCASAYSLAAIA